MSAEGLIYPSGSTKHIHSRKISSSNAQKDLWFICRYGSLYELDSALFMLKKNGGNVDGRNSFGLTPLHIATWRNHVPMVKRLLATGADPDARDGESGWSSLHRALHFGHLAVASVLLQSGASLTLEDSKCRIPVDLLSGPVLQVVGNAHNLVATEVFSWGSGANYQLGTGNVYLHKVPGKVDSLYESDIKIIAASKFHSVAVGANGEVFTWGYGRGGRLGHPDFDIHSGQAAVITPRQVTLGLGSNRVSSVAAAKHHTVISTDKGEVFTWGSNREGQLGYTSVDTQPTPRRVSSLKAKIIAVAAANKHSAAVSDSGEVFTWGCNKDGQLGYGTSISASNYTPRVVEYLKGKVMKGVSAAKYHTVALGSDGEVFTWGHKLVTPKRVVIARNTKKCGTAPLKFHRAERLHVVSVAAGVVHSTSLTDDGALFYWVSADPDLRCQQLYSICGTNIVSISAGKYWTAAVTDMGDVYMWDGKKRKDEIPVATRIHGVKHSTSVCVGETHLLILCSLYHPICSTKWVQRNEMPISQNGEEELEELDEGFMFHDDDIDSSIQAAQNCRTHDTPIPSLKDLCQKVAAGFLVEPRNAIQLLEIADTLDADYLQKHCEDVFIRNIDYIFMVSSPGIMGASLEILAKLEKSLDARSSEPWSSRRLPTATATFPAIIDSEEEGDSSNGTRHFRTHKNCKESVSKEFGDSISDCFLKIDHASDKALLKQVRALKKKLQQVEMLEVKQLNGQPLDDQQLSKLQTKAFLETALSELGANPERKMEISMIAPPLDVKSLNKKTEVSKKQKRRNKNTGICETLFSNNNICLAQKSLKGFNDDDTLQSKKVEIMGVDASFEAKTSEEHPTNKNKPHQMKALEPASTTKKKNKKGGLSMFLSGALDDSPEQIPPPPPPPLVIKSKGPAWGGTKVSNQGLTSLRAIQNEQSLFKEVVSNIKPKEQPEKQLASVLIASGRIQLNSFLPKERISSPIPVVRPNVARTPEGEKSTPSWSISGSSPVTPRPSLRDIQIQQEKKSHNIISSSPKTRSSGFSLPPHGSPSEPSGGLKEAAVPSRWFKPEMDSPSSIRSIQIEEKAMKDLRRFYSSVRLVKEEPKLC